MTAALFPDVRERPVAAGMVWAAMTVALMILFGLFFGHPMTLRQMAVFAALAPFGGLIWSFCMRWVLNRLAVVSPGAR